MRIHRYQSGRSCRLSRTYFRVCTLFHLLRNDGDHILVVLVRETGESRFYRRPSGTSSSSQPNKMSGAECSSRSICSCPGTCQVMQTTNSVSVTSPLPRSQLQSTHTGGPANMLTQSCIPCRLAHANHLDLMGMAWKDVHLPWRTFGKNDERTVRPCHSLLTTSPPFQMQICTGSTTPCHPVSSAQHIPPAPNPNTPLAQGEHNYRNKHSSCRFAEPGRLCLSKACATSAGSPPAATLFLRGCPRSRPAHTLGPGVGLMDSDEESLVSWWPVPHDLKLGVMKISPLAPHHLPSAQDNIGVMLKDDRTRRMPEEDPEAVQDPKMVATGIPHGIASTLASGKSVLPTRIGFGEISIRTVGPGIGNTPPLSPQAQQQV